MANKSTQTELTILVNKTGISENTIRKVLVAFAELDVIRQDFAISAAQKAEEALQQAVDRGAEGLMGESSSVETTVAPTKADQSDREDPVDTIKNTNTDAKTRLTKTVKSSKS